MHPAGAGERSVCLAANAAFLADAKSDRTEIHPRPQAYRSPKANLTLEGHITNPRIYIVKKSTPKRAFFGGPEEIRTLDLSDANRTLSQLSYRPKRKCYYILFFERMQAFCEKNLIFFQTRKKCLLYSRDSPAPMIGISTAVASSRWKVISLWPVSAL